MSIYLAIEDIDHSRTRRITPSVRSDLIFDTCQGAALTKRMLAFARRQDATGSSRCLYASRDDSVDAALRKPALSFCSRCEALAAPSSQRCPLTTAAASASNMARRGAKAVKGHTVATTFDNDNMEKLVE